MNCRCFAQTHHKRSMEIKKQTIETDSIKNILMTNLTSAPWHCKGWKQTYETEAVFRCVVAITLCIWWLVSICFCLILKNVSTFSFGKWAWQHTAGRIKLECVSLQEQALRNCLSVVRKGFSFESSFTPPRAVCASPSCLSQHPSPSTRRESAPRSLGRSSPESPARPSGQQLALPQGRVICWH